MPVYRDHLEPLRMRCDALRRELDVVARRTAELEALRRREQELALELDAAERALDCAIPKRTRASASRRLSHGFAVAATSAVLLATGAAMSIVADESDVSAFTDGTDQATYDAPADASEGVRDTNVGRASSLVMAPAGWDAPEANAAQLLLHGGHAFARPDNPYGRAKASASWHSPFLPHPRYATSGE